MERWISSLRCRGNVENNTAVPVRKLANRFDSSVTKEPRLFTYKVSFLIIWLSSNYKAVFLIIAQKQTKKVSRWCRFSGHTAAWIDKPVKAPEGSHIRKSSSSDIHHWVQLFGWIKKEEGEKKRCLQGAFFGPPRSNTWSDAREVWWNFTNVPHLS